MPRRPSVTTRVRREILQTCTLTSGGECLPDAVARGRVVPVVAQPAVRQAIRAAKDLAFTVRQVCQRRAHPGMQGEAAWLIVLRAAAVARINWKRDVAALEIDVAPI